MRFRLGFACAAAIVGAVLITNATATAQSVACSPDDLRCRIERLEARLAVLEAAPKMAAAPKVIYEAPTEMVTARRACKVNCEAEAAAVCKEHGFTGGKPKDWERPRSGPVTMTRAECDRPH